MIIRIAADGQYRVGETVLARLDAADDALEVAVQARDQASFDRELSRLLALVRDVGERMGPDHLGPSDLILPPDDISLAELAGEMSADGLIPD